MGLYHKDNNQNWLMVKNIVKDAELSDIENTIQFEFCEYKALIPPFLICASSEFLLESFKKNMNSPVTHYQKQSLQKLEV